MERNQKWKIPRKVLERRTLCISSYKNRKLKVKLWWVGAGKRKKRASFVPLILSTFFTYKKHYFIHFCCLFLKSAKAVSVSLNVAKSCQITDIPTRAIKLNKNIFTIFVMGHFNYCICYGEFTYELKHADLIPVRKTNEKC